MSPTTRERQLVAYRHAQHELDDGDLVLFRPRPLKGLGLLSLKSWKGALFGAAITTAGRSPYSHAGKLVKVRGRWFVAEMVEVYGGRLWPLERYAQTHSGLIDVFKPNHRSFDARGSVDRMLAFVGRPYGYRALLRAALLRTPVVRHVIEPLRLQDDEVLGDWPLFCSSAVAYADSYGGGVDPVPELDIARTEPGDLARGVLYGDGYALTIVWLNDTPPKSVVGSSLAFLLGMMG